MNFYPCNPFNPLHPSNPFPERFSISDYVLGVSARNVRINYTLHKANKADEELGSIIISGKLERLGRRPAGDATL
jgi:hypothetical protein